MPRPAPATRTLAALCVLLLTTGVAGCGANTGADSAQQTAPASPASAATSSPELADPSAPPADEDSTEVNGSLDGTTFLGKWVINGRDSFLIQPDQGEVGTLVNPTAGVAITAQPTLSGGQELRQVTYLYTAAAGTDRALAAFSIISTPSEGLTPASTDGYVDLFSATTGEPIGTQAKLDLDLGPYQDSEVTLVGASSDTVVLNLYDYPYPDVTAAWDLNTGQQRWNVTATGAGSGDGLVFTIVNEDIGCGHITARDIATGKKVWVRVANEIVPDPDNADDCAYLAEARTMNLDDGLSLIKDPTQVFTNQEGQPIGGRADVVLYDPLGKLVIAGDEHVGMTVTDVATGGTVFTLPAEQAEALGIEVKAALDGRIWIATTDERLIVDATNGQTVGTWEDDHPVASGPGWYLMGSYPPAVIASGIDRTRLMNGATLILGESPS